MKKPGSERTVATALYKINQLLPQFDALGLSDEVAKKYLDGTPAIEIAREICRRHVEIFFDVDIRIIRGAIHAKIREKVPEAQRKAQESKNRSQASKERIKKGMGIAKFDTARRREVAINGGKVSGKNNRDNKTGFFKRTADELSRDNRNASQESHRVRGHAHWNEERKEEAGNRNETEYGVYLATQSDFQKQVGTNIGKADCRKIAKELNRVFGGNKVAIQIRRKLAAERKKLLKAGKSENLK